MGPMVAVLMGVLYPWRAFALIVGVTGSLAIGAVANTHRSFEDGLLAVIAYVAAASTNSYAAWLNRGRS